MPSGANARVAFIHDWPVAGSLGKGRITTNGSFGLDACTPCAIPFGTNIADVRPRSFLDSGDVDRTGGFWL